LLDLEKWAPIARKQSASFNLIPFSLFLDLSF